MTKESQRASAILERIVLEFLEVITPSDRDLVVEKAFAGVRAKRAKRLSSVAEHPPIKREEDP